MNRPLERVGREEPAPTLARLSLQPQPTQGGVRLVGRTDATLVCELRDRQVDRPRIGTPLELRELLHLPKLEDGHHDGEPSERWRRLVRLRPCRNRCG